MSYNLFLFFVLLFSSVFSQASEHPIRSASEHGALDTIASITTEEHEHGTRVLIRGDDRIPTYKTNVLPSPFRIVLDIPCTSIPFTSRTIPLDKPDLKSIRIGYHLNGIRLVFDIQPSTIPGFTTRTQGRELSMTFDLRTPTMDKSLKAWTLTDSTSPNPVLAMTGTTDIEAVENKENDIIRPETAKGFNEPLVEYKEKSDSKESSIHEAVLTALSSSKIDKSLRQEDGAVFLKAAHAYNTRSWSETIEQLTYLINTYPSGTYTERAYFLLAEAYAHNYKNSQTTHFETIKTHYENAIYHFPESIYGKDAYFAIGNLYFNIGYYHEAVGYYNLVIEKNEGSDIALKAVMKKVQILQLKKKWEEALPILQDLLNRYPDTLVTTEAKIEMAKILFEMNRFSGSLEVLNELKTKEPQAVYRYPAISLYLGYNLYQLGNFEEARDCLFWAYNMDPGNEENHLVLTKIADVYRDSGLSEDAAKLYRLVVDRYPGKEGAFISLTRLAEQQEKGELKIKARDVIAIQFVDNTIDEPQKIYEQVMENLIEKDKTNPLIQLVMLRLALIHQKEKRYEESYDILMNLLKKYPQTNMKREVLHTMESVLETIFAQKMKNRDYAGVVNRYQRERDMIHELESARIFLIIARVFDHLKLGDKTTEMYTSADRLMQDKEKPPDLLCYLSEKEVDQGKYETALARLDLLIEQYPSDENISRASHLKGRIFLEQSAYEKAAEMFTQALTTPQSAPVKIRILLDKTKALVSSQAHSSALETLQQASRLIPSIYNDVYSLSLETGAFYLHLGYPQQAISIYMYALDKEKEKDNRMQLQLAIAKCYEALNQPKDYLALYQQISSLNDPFWSNLAKERMAAHDFQGKMMEAQPQ